MNWNVVVAVSEVVGAVAIVVTLIYLAAQIKQNTQMVRSEITKDLFVTANAKLLGIASNPELRKAAANLIDIPESELIESFVLISILREFELQFILRASNLLDPAVMDSYDSAVPLWLGSDEARKWWASNKADYNPDFVTYIDNLVHE
jgi:hypothetical protein